MTKSLLFGVPTWGSAVAELAFEYSKLPYRVEYLTPDQVRSDEYRKINPLAQIPSLRLPDGHILCGSLPICTYINDVGDARLIPDRSSPEYPTYLRWSFFLVDGIYAHAAYYDHPDWFVAAPAARDELRASVMQRIQERFRHLDVEAADPWFLGSRRSLIDCYLAVMTYWEPGEVWFREECPRLMRIVDRMRATPEFAKVLKNNHPEMRP